MASLLQRSIKAHVFPEDNLSNGFDIAFESQENKVCVLKFFLIYVNTVYVQTIQSFQN